MIAIRYTHGRLKEVPILDVLRQRSSTGGPVVPQGGHEAFTGGPQARPELDSQVRFSIAINWHFLHHSDPLDTEIDPAEEEAKELAELMALNAMKLAFKNKGRTGIQLLGVYSRFIYNPQQQGLRDVGSVCHELSLRI